MKTERVEKLDPSEIGMAVLVHLGTPRALEHFPDGPETVPCDRCGAFRSLRKRGKSSMGGPMVFASGMTWMVR